MVRFSQNEFPLLILLIIATAKPRIFAENIDIKVSASPPS